MSDGEIKRLYRSRENRVFAGIAGGFGEYFSLDPVLVRVIFIFMLFGTHFAGALLYVVLIFLIPNEPDSFETKAHAVNDKEA